MVSDSGFSSTFEDEDGSVLTPLRKPTRATALHPRKPVSRIQRDTSFVDWRKVRFKAGDGGDGCISFLHLVNCMNAGPDGGDGGNGAHIVLKANSQVKSLAGLQSHYVGEHGKHGEGKDIIGASGEHKFIEVPIGTLVKGTDGRLLADLDQEESLFVAARGGRGGKGNHFYLSDKNRHPFVAEVGAKGEERILLLEMKCVADCGFVGLPNVGKSTLLRAISRAKPRVASYPFTTLTPYVGVIQFDDYEQLSVADLPGLVLDAHLNRGLGIDFLKHVERCTCLAFVLDLSTGDAWQQLLVLRKELEHFKAGLSKKPHVIVGNKVDAHDAEEQVQQLRQELAAATPEAALPPPIVTVSAKFGDNIPELVSHLRALLDMYKRSPESE